MGIDKKSQKSARIPRLWLDSNIALEESSSVELPKRATHHLLKVLRATEGSTVELFNGDGNNYRAILANDGKKMQAVIQSIDVNRNESTLNTTLVQSISRGDRMDTSVQKCTELGVTRIQPVYTTHSIPLLKGDRAARKQDHWQAIAISAAEQSGRSVVPELLPACTLSQWLLEHWPNMHEQGAQGWVLDPKSEVSLSTNQLSSDKKQVILIGPETGLDPDEIMAAIQAGFTAIRFGNRILRTETAGPATLSVLQALAGDLLA